MPGACRTRRAPRPRRAPRRAGAAGTRRRGRRATRARSRRRELAEVQAVGVDVVDSPQLAVVAISLELRGCRGGTRAGWPTISSAVPSALAVRRPRARRRGRPTGQRLLDGSSACRPSTRRRGRVVGTGVASTTRRARVASRSSSSPVTRCRGSAGQRRAHAPTRHRARSARSRDGGEVAGEVGAPVAEAGDSDAYAHEAILSSASTTRAPARPSP
jgi:hypothetical protein